MSVGFRDVEVELRRARVERAFGTAVAPLREWSSDLAAPRAMLPETEVMPIVLDVCGLVDPFADSALSGANLNPAVAKGNTLDAPESTARASSPALQPRRRSWITARSPAQSVRLAALGSRRAGLACEPSQVASLLTRHDDVSAVLEEFPTAPTPSEAAVWSARNVVQLPLRRRGETATQLGAMRSLRTTASTIARWSSLMARDAADRGEPSTRIEEVAERRQGQPRPPDEPFLLSRAAFDAATLARYEFSQAKSPRADTTLRLTDLTAPEASARRGVATQPAASPGTASIEDPSSVAATERGSLGRVFDSLARIEQQVAARAGHAEPQTQWYEDDDGLACRIHDILRRQVERHGIDLP